MAEKPFEPEDQTQPTATPEPTADAEEATPTMHAEPGRFDAGEGEDLSELYAKLDSLTAEANAHRDRALRAAAELENYRRRALREKEETRKFASQNLFDGFLPILDNFHVGLEQAREHEAGKAFADGFAMIVSQIEGWLRSNGVERLEPKGEAFDPNLHEALAHLPHAEVPEHHVIDVTRVGYRLHDRLLRPAAVIISSGPPSAGPSTSEG
jgi:molecular chaperone GrpE